MQNPDQDRRLYVVLAWNKACRLSSTQQSRSRGRHCFHSQPSHLLALWDSLHICIDLRIGGLFLFLDKIICHTLVCKKKNETRCTKNDTRCKKKDTPLN